MGLAALTVVLLAGGVPAHAADDREDFEASFYFGLGVDSFAARDLTNYLNPEASGQKQERGVGGFDFAYRFWGAKASRRQVWVYGETVHGVRSADVDLGGRDSVAIFRLTGYTNPGERTLFMLRNATSLEATLGTRCDFYAVHPGTPWTSVIYAMAEYGFLTVAGLGQDVVDESRYGLGAECVTGDLRGSHLEIAYGRTDLFTSHHMTRLKLDGELQWTGKAMRALGMSMFAQITVDSDIGPGSDSVQSYLGFNFDLSNFLHL
jgi:hypothetical protein